MRTQMVIGRILVFVLAVIMTIWYISKETPELDGVKNAGLYRISYGMVLMRAFAYIAFDMFKLFPLE